MGCSGRSFRLFVLRGAAPSIGAPFEVAGRLLMAGVVTSLLREIICACKDMSIMKTYFLNGSGKSAKTSLPN